MNLYLIFRELNPESVTTFLLAMSYTWETTTDLQSGKPQRTVLFVFISRPQFSPRTSVCTCHYRWKVNVFINQASKYMAFVIET